MPIADRVAAILPARWASTRFPGKPLHVIAGKSLIQRVWEQARQAKVFGRVIIATDDARILEAAQNFGAEAILTSTGHQSGTDRLAEAARILKLEEAGITHIVNVQGDEPLIDPSLLDHLTETLLADPSIQMITSANEFRADEDVNNPNAVKVVLDHSGNALYFSRSAIPYRRDISAGSHNPVHLRHQGLYGYSLPFLFQFVQWPPSALEMTEQLEQLRALENGARIRVLVTKSLSVGVDTPKDAVDVEQLLAAR